MQGSTLTREADSTLLLRAGIEVGVASTKAFTSQLVCLNLLALLLGRMRHVSKESGQELIRALLALSQQVETILQKKEEIKALAHKYASYKNVFFIGRQQMFPVALEGALKLKEISYINANGYPAGEIKHGPIALIDEETLVIALCGNHMTYEKITSNIMELKARKAHVLAITSDFDRDIGDIADDVIYLPETLDELSAITTSVATQLFSYYVADILGANIDQPRNLAKSVTVE